VRRDLPLADLADFLALPLVAVLATYRKDGAVLLSPVRHQWRDGGFDVICVPDDISPDTSAPGTSRTSLDQSLASAGP
jgi:hypothetical protein